MDSQQKLQELETLRARVRHLEEEIAGASPPGTDWRPKQFYIVYFVMAGFVLGGLAALASLMFNIVGSVFFGREPMSLIKVFLTFPFGASALDLPEEQQGLVLVLGCSLYLITGMFLGVPFHLVLSRWFENSGFAVRFVVATVLSLGIWVVNFYLLLSWIQPALIGGNWILEMIPPWVAASTHLVFGWTMLLLQPFGTFANRNLER